MTQGLVRVGAAWRSVSFAVLCDLDLSSGGLRCRVLRDEKGEKMIMEIGLSNLHSIEWVWLLCDTKERALNVQTKPDISLIFSEVLVDNVRRADGETRVK